jgi:S-adenosyl-L-methionine hydrolase (adenosine-forming)
VPPALSLITLLTDFGDRDYFVGSMKGVILTINPQATIVDLSHHIAPHAIEEAAYVLKSCYASFPDGTIHVVVVDPGVGSARRPLLVKTDRYFFLAPDNGLLSYIFDEDNRAEVREITNKQFRLESAGTTFDGRDLFAPAAAWLSKNQPLSAFGQVVRDVRTFPIRKPRWESGTLVGEIVYVDRFGNVISNLTAVQLKELQTVTKRPSPLISIAGHRIDGLVNSYSEGDRDTPQALINSNGQLEIFLKEGHAAAALKVGPRDSIALT